MVEVDDASAPSETLPLHRHVYMDEPELLKCLLQTMRFGSCNTQDNYGNTPLHLAVMLGRSGRNLLQLTLPGCIDHLLAHGARVDIRNGWGWTPIDEAICRKNSPVAYKLWHIMRTADQEKAERLFFEDFLTKVPDADIHLEWELHSWVPFVSRFLPSDKCRVRKKGNKVRVDMSLKGFQDFGWLRGDISFLLDGSRLFDEKVVMLDHEQKLYECVTSQLSEVDSAQFDLEWSLISSSPVVTLRILHDNLSCVPNYSGWFNSEQQKVDQVGQYRAKSFTLSNLVVESQSRHEHVSESKYSNALANLLGLLQSSLQAPPQTSNALPEVSESSNPPPATPTAAPTRTRSSSTSGVQLPPWNAYCSGSLTPKALFFGCNPVIKRKSLNISFSVSFAEEIFFPIHVYLSLLDLLAPRNNLSALRDALSSKAPSGFPVQIEAAVFPTVTAKLRITSIEYTHPPMLCHHELEWGTCPCSQTVDPSIFTGTELDDDLFSIPLDYAPA
ncbi:Ankyrin repeat domain-containing protein 13C [Sparganum proliferum]